MVDVANNLEGGYGFGEFFDNIDQNQMFEYCLTPQHESRGLVAAIQCRDATNKEMERQVKKYGREQLGRSALIIDDRHLHDLSKKGNPSQKELADRICGHVSSHHPGGLSIFIAQQAPD